MEDLVYIAGESLERDVAALGHDEVMNSEALERHLGNVKVRGMNSSYAYLVSRDGTMVYHPTADKIGQPVENDAVKLLMGEISRGNRPETDVIRYNFNGVIKYAAFYISQDMNYILVVTGDESEILRAVRTLTVNSCIGGGDRAFPVQYYRIYCGTEAGEAHREDHERSGPSGGIGFHPG